MSQPAVSVNYELDRVAIVRLAGEHDLSSADEVREALRAATGSRAAVIDLSHAEFVDSSILGLVVEAHRSSVEEGRGFALVVAPEPAGPVRRMLELTGITSVVGAHDTLERAIQEVAAGA